MDIDPENWGVWEGGMSPGRGDTLGRCHLEEGTSVTDVTGECHPGNLGHPWEMSQGDVTLETGTPLGDVTGECHLLWEHSGENGGSLAELCPQDCPGRRGSITLLLTPSLPGPSVSLLLQIKSFFEISQEIF